MSDTPVFTSQQFINAASLNTLVSNASGSVVSLTNTVRFGGLAGPNQVVLTSNGLVVTAYLPSPFHVVFGSGTISFAHGTVDGIDNQIYTVDFTPLVPVSGPPSTAYIILSHASVQLNQYAVVGPPPGHPDFNANFQPYLTYGTISDSVAAVASLTPPDNITTFELARISLAVGATGVGNLITAYQQRSSDKYHLQIASVSGSVLQSEVYNGRMAVFQTSGLFTLPPLSIANTEQYFLSTINTKGLVIIQGNTSDPFGPNLIYGSTPNPIFGAPAIILTPGVAVSITAANGHWQILSGNARATMFRAMLVGPTNFYVDAQAGNDNNNGQSTGSPFQTLQYAHDYVKNSFDLAGYSVNYICNGNYNTGVISGGPWVGMKSAGDVQFTFNTGSSVIVNQGDCFMTYNYSVLAVYGNVTLSASASGANSGHALHCFNLGRVIVGSNINFGACADSHIRAGLNSLISIRGNYTISGNSPNHFSSDDGGVIAIGATTSDSGPSAILPLTVTLIGTPVFSGAFAFSDGGTIEVGSSSMVFSGTASGQRYFVSQNGFINTLASGPTYFPGTVPGSGTSYISYQ